MIFRIDLCESGMSVLATFFLEFVVRSFIDFAAADSKKRGNQEAFFQ